MNRFQTWRSRRRAYRTLFREYQKQEATRLAREGKPACAICGWVQVARDGLYCAPCADGLH